MTAERDRLAATIAADLPDLIEHYGPTSPSLPYQIADRLIAAGVGFRSVGVEEVIAQAQANLAKSEVAADREITRLRALVEQQPDLDVERLARALRPLLPQHLEGKGGYPHQSSDTSWTVYDWMTPETLAAAIAKAYRDD